MDINFHYFAVKVIAVMAGYDDFESNIIASYSQYVDDFFDDHSFRVNTPPPFSTPIYDRSSGYVTTVPTAIKVTSSLTEAQQKNVIIPFHFIPPKPLSKAGEGYRTTPSTWAGTDNQLITTEIRNLLFVAAPFPGRLIYLGALLHIFADTYAHQSFNGFHQTHINRGQVLQATAAYYSGATEEKSYGAYSFLPAVGHGTLGPAPDETALTYRCLRDNGAGTLIEQPVRTNAQVFLKCAYEILKILCAANGAPAPGEQQFNELAAALLKGFGVSASSNIDELCTHWSHYVPSISGRMIHYHYSASEIHHSFLQAKEDKLPPGVSLQQVNELWERLSLPVNEEDSSCSRRQEACEKLDALLQADVIAPTLDFYCYNDCAYEIRKVVNI